MDTTDRTYAHWKATNQPSTAKNSSNPSTFNLRYDRTKYDRSKYATKSRLQTTSTATNGNTATSLHANKEPNSLKSYGTDVNSLIHHRRPTSSTQSSSVEKSPRQTDTTSNTTTASTTANRFKSTTSSSFVGSRLPASTSNTTALSRNYHHSSNPSSTTTTTANTTISQAPPSTSTSASLTDKLQNIHLHARTGTAASGTTSSSHNHNHNHSSRHQPNSDYPRAKTTTTNTNTIDHPKTKLMINTGHALYPSTSATNHTNRNRVHPVPASSALNLKPSAAPLPKPTTTIARTGDTAYNLSLIRPSDRVVLYCPAAHCYVNVTDFDDMDMDMDTDDTKRDDKPHDRDSNNNTDGRQLKCEDMEGSALLIGGESSFCGTCKFLADCKIQLVTGQRLYKDRDRIIVHNKHATKFMLQRADVDAASNTGAMCIGHKVLIFVEASRSNAKQFWSYDVDTQSIVLRALQTEQPTPSECFVLQKYGQPLRLLKTGENKHDDHGKPQKQQHDGYVVDKFFAGDGASVHVQEFYLCHDILRVLSCHDFSGDFIEFTRDAVYGFPKVVFNAEKYAILPLLSSAVRALQPLLEHTAQVRHFVAIHSTTEYGVVSQALCAEIGKHLKDFGVLLAQLETRLNAQELTLQNIRFYLQRASRTMSALQHICHDVHMNKQKKMQIASPSSSSSLLTSSWSSYKLAQNDLLRMHDLDSMDMDMEMRMIPLGCRGGALLNMLQKHIDTSGEKHVRFLYTKLLKSASVPYFEMLANWIYRGMITDIYGEFMIREQTHLKKEDVAQEYNNQYWTGRYSLNRLQIPCILYEYQDMIVTTGKYLNVMRESGCFVEQKAANNSSSSSNNKLLHTYSASNSRELGECIHAAYNFASQALLEMLMNRERIVTRFESIGKYMLLQCADWFLHFLDMAHDILIKNAGEIKKTKLDRLLELSMRTSNSTKNDPFKDDVCCDIKHKDLNKMIVLLHELRNKEKNANKNNSSNVADHQHHQVPSTTAASANEAMHTPLTGIEAFALNYKVEWPASIIFTGRNVIRYQLIFRFLFKLKFVSRLLKTAWTQHMALRQLNLFNTHNASLMLRQKMFCFVESLLFYISYQVIEPNWREFMKHVQQQQMGGSGGGGGVSTSTAAKHTVDSLLSAQECFLRTTMEQCLLTNTARIDALFQILRCCEAYCNFVNRYTSDWQIYETTKASSPPSTLESARQRQTAIQMLEQDCRESLSSNNFKNAIDKYSKSFEEAVRTFLNDLQRGNHSSINMNVLLSRLDFNAYYMPKLSF